MMTYERKLIMLLQTDEIVKKINLSNEMDSKEWLKIAGAKLWLIDQTKIDNVIITSAMIVDTNSYLFFEDV